MGALEYVPLTAYPRIHHDRLTDMDDNTPIACLNLRDHNAHEALCAFAGEVDGQEYLVSETGILFGIDVTAAFHVSTHLVRAIAGSLLSPSPAAPLDSDLPFFVEWVRKKRLPEAQVVMFATLRNIAADDDLPEVLFETLTGACR